MYNKTPMPIKYVNKNICISLRTWYSVISTNNVYNLSTKMTGSQIIQKLFDFKTHFEQQNYPSMPPFPCSLYIHFYIRESSSYTRDNHTFAHYQKTSLNRSEWKIKDENDFHLKRLHRKDLSTHVNTSTWLLTCLIINLTFCSFQLPENGQDMIYIICLQWRSCLFERRSCWKRELRPQFSGLVEE